LASRRARSRLSWLPRSITNIVSSSHRTIHGGLSLHLPAHAELRQRPHLGESLSGPAAARPRSAGRAQA
jgi:hypothetical protein